MTGRDSRPLRGLAGDFYHDFGAGEAVGERPTGVLPAEQGLDYLVVVNLAVSQYPKGRRGVDAALSSERRDDLPGAPLSLEVAIDNLVGQLLRDPRRVLRPL